MKRKSIRIGALLAGTLAYLAVVCGCGSAESFATKSSDGAYANEAAALDYATEESLDLSTGGNTLENADGSDSPSKSTNRKLITNMSMTVETKSFDSTMDYLQRRTEELGGYVESFSTSNRSYNDSRYGELTLRVPEEKLDGFVNEVAEKSNITYQDKRVTDVTLTYTDLQSHKDALLAEEKQLLLLMEQATTIEEIISIQDRLTEVRYQIDSMESQLRTYDNQITYSTLDVSVNEVIDYTTASDTGFFEAAKQGFVENVHDVLAFLTSFALLIITHIPTLLLIVLVVLIILLITKLSVKRRRKKYEKRMMMQASAPGQVVNVQIPNPGQATNPQAPTNAPQTPSDKK